MTRTDETLEPKSKSEKKREAEAVKAVGAELVDLPPAKLNEVFEKVELPDKLQEALLECRSLKVFKARKRQLQYIGKLMRDIDVEPIQQLLAEFKVGGQAETAQHHRIERWRERLLSEGDTAFNELMQLHPEADAKHIQQLIASAHKEATHQQPPRSARLLFRYLREIIG
jgi:ribosome-associated protein